MDFLSSSPVHLVTDVGTTSETECFTKANWIDRQGLPEMVLNTVTVNHIECGNLSSFKKSIYSLLIKCFEALL
jgi:hypothetical protein